MSRLLIHVEGQTEETFVNEVLSPHLYNFGYTNIGARLIGNARLKRRRGGIRPWNTVREDILKHLKEDRQCLATTMVDFYGLPQTGKGAWPGRALAGTMNFSEKALTVETALEKDIQENMGGDFDTNRFIPYVMMHEFEGLLFSDCAAFSRGIGRPELEPGLLEIRNSFESPEEINDSPITAPSKRIESIISGYEKPIMGSLAALEIGLDTIRQECPHFGAWIARLEKSNIQNNDE